MLRRGGVAAEAVDLELVLAADGSGSIDDDELALQRSGYAAAINHPQVLDVIKSGFLGKIAIAYIEWGGPYSQHTIVDWTLIADAASAKIFAEALVVRPREAVSYNSISNAIAYSQNLIATNNYAGTRKIIDVSADAGQIGGRPLFVVRAEALVAGITINGLAINRPGSTRPFRGIALEDHFAADIIGGPGAFVITVGAELRFAEAVLKKLILEIAGRSPGTPTQLGARPDPGSPAEMLPR